MGGEHDVNGCVGGARSGQVGTDLCQRDGGAFDEGNHKAGVVKVLAHLVNGQLAVQARLGQRHANVFALGDACSASNAKTMAAARKQAPVVAVNALAVLDGKALVADYDGYGSCPLTVEAGKIVLAEFGYGGKLLPSFPNWLIDGTRPSRLSWLLKDTILPPIYWHGMLKGREWMVKPHPIAA